MATKRKDVDFMIKISARVDHLARIRLLRPLGEADAVAGKPMSAFFEIPNIRHSEAQQAEYENGYRAKKEEMRKRRGR